MKNPVKKLFGFAGFGLLSAAAVFLRPVPVQAAAQNEYEDIQDGSASVSGTDLTYYGWNADVDNFYTQDAVRTSLTAIQRWKDDYDRDGIRPTEVLFTLQVRTKGGGTWQNANWENSGYGTMDLESGTIVNHPNPVSVTRSTPAPDAGSGCRQYLVLPVQ